MSRFSRTAVPCAHCGNESLQTIYASVNAVRSASLRAEILAERFHRFECPFCREWFTAEPPLVYVDVARRQWIVQNPRGWEVGWRAREAEAQQQFVEATRPPHVSSGAEALFAGTRLRVVFGMAALREKILCFEAGLDDAALEALKLDLMRSPDLDLPLHPAGRPRLHEVSSDEIVLLAVPPTGDDDMARIAVPRAAVEEIARAAGFEGVLRELRSGSYVDVGRIMIGGGHDA